MTIECLDRTDDNTIQPSPSQKRANARRRALELLQSEIDFIPNSTFGADNAKDDGLVENVLQSSGSTSKVPGDLPAHLRRMCEAELLTHEQEVALFRGMNYLKYRAHVLRSQLDPQRPHARIVEQIDLLLFKAQTMRDYIVQANMRLAMSIVKKFVTPQQSFDDMLSDGIIILMQAVEKFDYDRGFRFSTYAYRSIARHAYRSVMTTRKDELRCTNDGEEWTFEQRGVPSTATSEQVWSKLRELAGSMLNKLDRRERFIVRCRYALGSHRKVRTCQFLAEKLGISKERVRQLELRAVAKLRELAAEFETDELFTASMV